MPENTITPEPVKPEITNGVIAESGKTRPMVQGDHELAKMGKEGDTKSIWDMNNPDEVKNAERTFKDLTDKGYKAFKVTGKNGERGEEMKKFDPSVERMIMVPQLQGG